MIRLLRKLATCAASLSAAVLIAQSVHAENLNGKWFGDYTCGQGITAVTLTIEEVGSGEGMTTLRGDFSFYAHPDNPWVPSGSYAMAGHFDPETNEVLLKGTHWDFQPWGYEMVDLLGSFTTDDDGDILSGDVFFRELETRLGCTTFHLRRIGAAQNLF